MTEPEVQIEDENDGITVFVIRNKTTGKFVSEDRDAHGEVIGLTETPFTEALVITDETDLDDIISAMKTKFRVEIEEASRYIARRPPAPLLLQVIPIGIPDPTEDIENKEAA